MTSRIAIFFPQLAAGGVQRSLLLLTDGFLHQGLQVDLVVGWAAGPFLNQIPDGARLIDLHSNHVRSALPGLIRYLKASTPAALLSAQTHANIISAWARRLANPKFRLVVSEHNDMVAVVRAPGAGKDRLRPLLARLFYPWADEVVAVSAGVAESLSAMAGLSPASIHIIYNPLIPRDLEVRKQAPCPHPWLVAGGPPVILAAGRLAQQKDYPSLIHAFALLAKKRQDVRLLILGEGPEQRTLETLIDRLGLQAVVKLAGYVENVFACMARASVFVLPSAWEGFPSVLVEAMACGVPVVATDCPSGPAEILENGRLGRLVPVGDSVSMAESLEAALLNPGPVELARLKAEEFTMERAVQEYLPLLLGTNS
jgi:glycosyltransferase involved in cell wall biosynthesis